MPDLQLGEIHFAGSQTCTLTNQLNAIELLRPVSTIRADNVVNCNTPVKGTGANVIEKAGAGTLVLAKPVTDVASFDLVGGMLQVTNGTSLGVEMGVFRHKEGKLRIAADTNASRVDYRYQEGHAILELEGGKSLTVKSLERDVGGTLTIVPRGGFSTLGDTSKFFVDSAPVPKNGMVDASVTVYDILNSKEQLWGCYFATYDAENGFVPAADPVAYDVSADQSAAIVKIDEATTVPAEGKSVYAAYLDSSAGTLTLEGDMRIGDGSQPAGVIVRDVVNKGPMSIGLTGEGAIDFGTAPGVVWVPSCMDVDGKVHSIDLGVSVKGSAGVTFTGGTDYGSGSPANSQNSTAITFRKPASWTGPTVISRGVRGVLVKDVNPFPPGGDVYVTGYSSGGNGSLRITDSFAFDQHFHFSGSGHRRADWGWASGLMHLGGVGTVVTFNGPVSIRDTMRFHNDGSGYMVNFNRCVDGTGALDLDGSANVTFAATNTFSGFVNVRQGCSLTLSGVGTFGSGRVANAGTLKFVGCQDLVVTNAITSTGAVTISGGKVRFEGAVKFTKVTVGDNAVVEVGPDVDLGKVTFSGAAQVLPLGTTAVSVGLKRDETDYFMGDNARLDDNMTLVKTGTNTVTLTDGFGFGGKIVIDSGRVRLAGGLLYRDSCIYWLDASQPETVTAADGLATKWTSANGNGTTFGLHSSSLKVGYTNTLNGLSVMTHDGYRKTRFVCSTPRPHQTVFVVQRPDNLQRSEWSWPAAFGWSGKDGYSIRFNRNNVKSGCSWDASFGSCRVNGKATVWWQDQEPQITTVTRTSVTNFPPAIGGFATWNDTCNYNGDIAEVIAFSRLLTEGEIKSVENYLSKKWGLSADGLWPAAADIAASTGILAASVRLELSNDGVLDLNGISQTVASLTGFGVITNSSSVAARLTVTGACDFSGRICAGVELVKSSSDADGAFSGFLEGGVTAAGGKMTVDRFSESAPTNGLLFWLDAATAKVGSVKDDTPNTICTNATGLVSRWNSRAGTKLQFNARNTGPTYRAAGFNGKFNSVYLDGNNIGLESASKMSPHTIAVMGWFETQPTAYNYIFSYSGSGDVGVRIDKNYGIGNGYCYTGVGSFSTAGDFLYLNGVRKDVIVSMSDYAAPHPFFCYIATRGDWHTADTWNEKNLVFGSFAWSHGNSKFHFGEMLGYDRVLSDAECQQLSRYLMAKWQGDALPQPVGAIAPGAGLGVDGAATLDIAAFGSANLGVLKSGSAGGTVTGDLTISGFSYDAEGATAAVPLAVDGALTIAEGADFTATGLGNLKRTSWTLLSSESATGAFETFAAGPRKWTFDAKATSWGLGVPGLLLFIK